MKQFTFILFCLFIPLCFFTEGLFAEGLSDEPFGSSDPFVAPGPIQALDYGENWREYPKDMEEYRRAILMTADMIYDQKAQRMAAHHGLNILNVTWEDTGRYDNSAVGPNISDMTIQVGYEDSKTGTFDTTLMPVFRYPNFTDLSTDLSPWDFTMLVGNEKGEDLKRISLHEFLEHPRDFLTDPSSWPGTIDSLLSPRDEKVLVSAQACFLPIPKEGEAVFNPVLFNYQSYAENPAVLTVLVTREGTSTTIIDNTRDALTDGFSWGQRLFHNRNGERASLTGRRQSEFLADPDNAEVAANTPSVGSESGLNMVLLIQIPLKYEVPEYYFDDYEYDLMMDGAVQMAPMESSSRIRMSDVENAVIGSGEVEGPYTEMDGIEIERDPNFPVRVTVQFYKGTSNGIVSQKDVDEIAQQIESVFSQGDYVSSLVTGGRTGRITEYYGNHVQPEDWWLQFWARYEDNFGISREEAIKRLQEMIGPNYMDRPVTELYLRDLLREEQM